jgi:hypothetical protein
MPGYPASDHESGSPVRAGSSKRFADGNTRFVLVPFIFRVKKMVRRTIILRFETVVNGTIVYASERELGGHLQRNSTAFECSGPSLGAE